MKRTKQIVGWLGVVGMSVAVHAAAFADLGRTKAGHRERPRPPASVEISVAPPPPHEAAPLPAAPAPAHVAPRVAAAHRAPRAAAHAAPAASASPAAAPEPAPADFSGLTLTNDGPGAGWATATGNGQSMKGPLGRAGGRRPGHGGGGGAMAGDGPAIVGLGDLSRMPQAPDLRDKLARAYPAEARLRGLEGKAVVRARIMPDGRVRELALLSESAAGFGSACQETLRGSGWSPPLDRSGAAVSTFINYTCRFNVQ
jgi:TonB family protein